MQSPIAAMRIPKPRPNVETPGIPDTSLVRLVCRAARVRAFLLLMWKTCVSAARWISLPRPLVGFVGNATP